MFPSRLKGVALRKSTIPIFRAIPTPRQNMYLLFQVDDKSPEPSIWLVSPKSLSLAKSAHRSGFHRETNEIRLAIGRALVQSQSHYLPCRAEYYLQGEPCGP